MTPCIDHGGANEWYTTARHNGKVIGKHVKVLIDAKGDRRPLRALHHCGNNRCINAEHLYWGTQSQNIKDAVEHGTHDPHRSFTEEEVAFIVATYVPYHRQYGGPSLARQFNVAPQTIARIAKNRGYSHK